MPLRSGIRQAGYQVGEWVVVVGVRCDPNPGTVTAQESRKVVRQAATVEQGEQVDIAKEEVAEDPDGVMLALVALGAPAIRRDAHGEAKRLATGAVEAPAKKVLHGRVAHPGPFIA